MPNNPSNITPNTTSAAASDPASIPTSRPTPTATSSTPATSIVIYFSRGDEEYAVGTVAEGNTKLLADEIARQTGADTFQIVPAVKYPADYMSTVDLATTEKEQNLRPAYQGDIDLSSYSTIYLGYPIWWGDLPMVVYTFLDRHADDLTGKTLIPFNTHEGSGNSGTYAALQQKFPTTTLKGDGFNLSGHEARTPAGLDKLRAWLATLN